MMTGSDSGLSVGAVLARWPFVCFALDEYVRATQIAPELHARLDAFRSGLTAPLPSEKVVVAGFNSWVRHRIKAYMNHGPIEGLHELPVLAKNDVRANPAAHFHIPAVARPWVWEKPTTGSTGAPLRMLYGPEFYFGLTAHAVHKIALRGGIVPSRPFGLYSLTLSDRPTSPHHLTRDPTAQAGLALRTGIDFACPRGVRDFADMMIETRPFAISSKPGVLEMLCRALPRSAAVAAGVELVVSGGSLLDDGVRERVSEHLEAPVRNAYGISEVGTIASECAAGTLHVDTSSCHLETQPGIGGASGGEELIVSSVGNSIMPMIRYRTGDCGRVESVECACGASGPAIVELHGRVVPVFSLADGSLFSPTCFMDLHERYPQMREYQLTQTAKDQFVLRVDPRERASFAVSHIDAIAAHVARVIPGDVLVEARIAKLEDDGKFQRYRTELQ